MTEPRVLLIGLDAAEPSLVERWMDDGTLPQLAALRARGSSGRLASSAQWLAGSPWPSFYTGSSPSAHGVYHFLQWRAESMRVVRPAPDWLPQRPFWRAFDAGGPRAIAIDVPMTYSPEPFDGLELVGWASHDHLCPTGSHPAAALRAIQREYGRRPLIEEVYGPQRPAQLLGLRDDLVRATGRVADLCAALMRREPWQLFLACFGAPHRGGHKLWDATGAEGEITAEDERALGGALRDVYTACDDAVGRLVAAAGDSVSVLVFALHGMGPNPCRTDLLPDMLDRVLRGGAPPAAEPRPLSALQRVRALLPLELRHAVKRRLPLPLQDRLTAFWRMRRTDWSRTRAFCVPADLQGYIRFNRAGREAAGALAGDAECERVFAELAQGLGTFRDADSGEPVVAAVERTAHVLPEGARLELLPDVLVRWSDSPVARHRAIVSERYGEIAWPTPGRNPDGRSGNHRGEGFFVAAGSASASAAGGVRADIRDLAPTACAWLGIAPPFAMEGRPIDGVV